MDIPRPYLVFLGDVHDELAAKTGHGVAFWRPEQCIGQLRLPGCGADLGLPELDIAAGLAAGARTLLLGVVNPGGVLPEHWVDVIVQALVAGLDVASGLHTRLGSVPAIRSAAERHGRRLFDARHSDVRFPTAKGTRRPGRRLLTVGTDCSSGKKYTALALERALRERGVDAEFKATGQTGVLIAERGVAVDAVAADFIAGAVEWLSPAAAPEHWDVIEGQGSLLHPSFGGVALGLLHGAQPDAFVICHEPTRTRMRNVAAPMPTIREILELTIRLGRLTNPEIRPIGIAVDTHLLGEAEAQRCLDELRREHGLPVSDPVRYGVAAIVERLLVEFPREVSA